MKVDKETALFRVLSGSRLYGTANESSDYDYKVVCLPALDDLLLNKKVTNRKVKPEGLKAGDRMVAGEEETEYLPLQVFLDDFFNGQTYALETAFAVKQRLHTSTNFLNENPFDPNEQMSFDYCVEMVNELIDNFLTRNVKKMVGYAVSQAKVYGLKTERFATIGAAIKLLEEHQLGYPDEREYAKITLGESTELLAKLLALPHVRESEVLNAKGGTEMARSLEMAGKQFTYSSKLPTVRDSLEKVMRGYGERVKDFEGQGVDWKALSHAIRITEQVLELTATGNLVFPRPNAKMLATIKSGKMSLDEATEHLNAAFEKVDEAVNASVLQERTPELEKQFEQWKLKVLHKLYAV
jgi:hypothetical protein